MAWTESGGKLSALYEQLDTLSMARATEGAPAAAGALAPHGTGACSRRAPVPRDESERSEFPCGCPQPDREIS
jgi:hypothetical protein